MLVIDWLSGWLHADLATWTWRLVHISALGQTAFVILWALLPWYRTWVGRALMSKSLALAIYLDFVVVVDHWGPFGGQQTLAVVLFGLITLGIWTQLGVIAFEVVRAWLVHRRL